MLRTRLAPLLLVCAALVAAALVAHTARADNMVTTDSVYFNSICIRMTEDGGEPGSLYDFVDGQFTQLKTVVFGQSANSWGAIESIAEFGDANTFFVGGSMILYESGGGGARLKYLARYNATDEDWIPLPLAVVPDGPVTALEVLGSKMFIGGTFTHVGDMPCTGLYSLDYDMETVKCYGDTFNAFATGEGLMTLAGQISSSGAKNLYVGGMFTMNIKNIRNIAFLDSTGTFQVVDPNIQFTVTAMGEDGFAGVYYAVQNGKNVDLVYTPEPAAGATPTPTLIASFKMADGSQAAVNSLLLTSLGLENEVLYVGGRFDIVVNDLANNVVQNASSLAWVHTSLIRRQGTAQWDTTQLIRGDVAHMAQSFISNEIYITGLGVRAYSDPEGKASALAVLNPGNKAVSLYSPAGFDGAVCATQGVFVGSQLVPAPGSDSSGTAKAAVAATFGALGVAALVFAAFYFGFKSIDRGTGNVEGPFSRL